MKRLLPFVVAHTDASPPAYEHTDELLVIVGGCEVKWRITVDIFSVELSPANHRASSQPQVSSFHGVVERAAPLLVEQ